MAGPGKPTVTINPNGTAPVATGNTGSVLQMQQLTSGMTDGTVGAFQYQPKTTDTSYLTQTSQPDIAALVNSTMQQLLGRNATPQEISQYGAELLAAERQNQGTYRQELSYSTTTGKPLQATGQQTTTGVDPSAFLQNLISGSGNAKEYRAATQYFDGMIQALQQQKAQ